MRKCAVFSCRSGYRPNKQEMIARKETPPCLRHVFAVPKKAEFKAKWAAVICRQDTGFNPNNFGVCDFHFKPQDFALDIASRTKTERQPLKLKPDAIPSVFNIYQETA